MSAKRKEESLARTTSKSRSKRHDHPRPESERDSGFSDASSEYLSVVENVESDDASRTSGAPGGGSSHAPVPPSQLAVVGGFSPNMSPMIIMNNVLLKQPGETPPTLKPWGFSPAVEMVPQPQVVFLQPVVSTRAPTLPAEPPFKRRRHKKYLPILKSYPKIAPHPGDSPHSSSSSTCSTTSSVASSTIKSCSSTPSHQEPHRRDKQGSSLTAAALPCSLPASPLPNVTSPRTPAPGSTPTRPSPIARSVSVPAVAPKSVDSLSLEVSHPATPTDSLSSVSSSPCPSINTSSSRSSSSCNDPSNGHEASALADADPSNKRKRFCNTYNILSRSGLLDITLRTKELIRQNRRTQGDLDRLRLHTDLFLEVLRSGDTGAIDRLKASMQEESEKERSA